MATEKLTVGQRISKITEAVGQVRATGKNAQGVVALSNEDIEDSLRALVAKHGVIMKWTLVKAESYQEPTRNGSMTLWRLDFKVRVESDDDPADGFDAEWMDIGGSPAAAESFAVKGYYKRLFHIASADDERQEPHQRATQAQDGGYGDEPTPAPKPKADPLDGLPAGFTAEQWADVRGLASSAKLRVGSDSEAWRDFPYNSPGKLKVHISKLHEGADGTADAADRALYAYETVRGELEALGAGEPPADRPGTLSQATVEQTRELLDDDALRQAALATG